MCLNSTAPQHPLAGVLLWLLCPTHQRHVTPVSFSPVLPDEKRRLFDAYISSMRDRLLLRVVDCMI
ncbi:hypothetical protein KTH_52430 [Thermosporothrix hazakensis]|nr:hypothetical protein KTH_52430 [Thermosporothrix hazakensis]